MTLEKDTAIESRFLAGRRVYPWDLFLSFRLLRELYLSFRKFRTLGPCVLVVGQNSEGLRWSQSVAACEAMGRWLASQGFTVLTLGETGLAERLAQSAERVGGRVRRCALSTRSHTHRADAFDFRFELVRRLVVTKFSYATLALGPTGEAPGTVHFLLALARFGRLPDHSLLVYHPEQWGHWPMADAHEALATRPIESMSDLARELETLLSA